MITNVTTPQDAKHMHNVAAKWWRNQLVNPRYDNGDTSERGLMTSMMATMATTPATEEQLDKFEECLSRGLYWEDCNGNSREFWVGVDYNPDRLLAHAGQFAEIPGGGNTGFPWKTTMHINTAGMGKITVREGYGAEPRQIYPAHDEVSAEKEPGS